MTGDKEMTTTLTPEEMAEAMREIERSDGWDVELAHIRADAVMVKALTSLGYGEAMAAYEAMEKWYA